MEENNQYQTPKQDNISLPKRLGRSVGAELESKESWFPLHLAV